MRGRERARVARYVHEAVAPAPPLPPVAGTDAVAAFAAQLAAAPRLNRLGVRALLLAHAAGLGGRSTYRWPACPRCVTATAARCSARACARATSRRWPFIPSAPRAPAPTRRGTVVDPDLQVHGVRGLYVADGSAVPSSPQVNPQVTIMAFAVRLGRALAGARDGALARMPA